MTIYPYNDVDEGEIIQDSIEFAALTVELRDLLDELDLPRQTKDRLAALIRDRDREAGRLAYCYGVRVCLHPGRWTADPPGQPRALAPQLLGPARPPAHQRPRLPAHRRLGADCQRNGRRYRLQAARSPGRQHDGDLLLPHHRREQAEGNGMYRGRPAPKEASINRPGNGLKIRCLVFPLGSFPHAPKKQKNRERTPNGRQIPKISRNSS